MTSQQESKTFSIRILVDKEKNKVIALDTTNDFLDTLFSFLSLPLATIVCVLDANGIKYDPQQTSQSLPFLSNIKHLYEIVQNTPNDVWNNPICKQMLLHPKNPYESQCMKVFLNVEDNELSNDFFVCDSCDNFTIFQNLNCICGKSINIQPRNLDSKGEQNNAQDGVFVRENEIRFLVSDALKIVPYYMENYVHFMMELGYSNANQIDEVTLNIGKQEILNILKYTLTSHTPLTNTFLASISKNKEDNLPKQSASVKIMSPTSNKIKIDVNLIASKSLKKIFHAEAEGDFVDFVFSFLTMPLGSIGKLFGATSLTGCVGNLYKSLENMDSSFCTDLRSMLLDPGVAPHFGCPTPLFNIRHVLHPTYYYGTGIPKKKYNIFKNSYHTTKVKIKEGVISTTRESIYNARVLNALDPRSLNKSREGDVAFVNRGAIYAIDDDFRVKPPYSHRLIWDELKHRLDDLEVKKISIGEAEALSFLGAFLSTKFTLTNGLQGILDVFKQDVGM